ncbi:MAG: heavy metal translocating P-type ATPase [Planctomycetota bacterium]|nr:heavy metal translocating P-type ATPase [Planctomycetota bacterium]
MSTLTSSDSLSVAPPPLPVSAATLCTHCGLPVPTGLIRAGEPAQFCCHGCETAFSLISSCGLEKYYAIRDELQAPTKAVRASDRSFAEFDDAAFRTLHVSGSPGEACSVELFLAGVHCSACAWILERLPRLAPGVLEARLDLRRSLIRVTWDDGAIKLSRIARVLDAIGYRPHPARDARSRGVRIAEDRRQLIRLGIAGACAANVMLFALCLYAGLFDTIDTGHQQMFRWISMGFTVLSLAWPGAIFFRSAWAAVRARAAHLDVPIALALAAGGVWSVIATVRGHGEIYFDTVSVLVFALLVGRFFQARQQRSAADAVELLFSLTPASARRVEGDIVRDVPIEAVRAGDVLEVLAGESMPVDGRVVSGRSLVDESLLSGESRPIDVGVGSPVAAGSVNISSALHVRVDAIGERTRIGKLMRLVEDASCRKAPIVAWADKASSWFTLGMLGLAGLTLAVWLILNPATAVEHAVALLVVTCPCALGLATPLVLTIAHGRAARLGMLIKGGDVIQRLTTPGIVYLDKTGTITLGRLSVVAWDGTDESRALASALEEHSSHPVARAVRDFAGPAEGRRVERVHQITGGGIEGLVDGRRVLVGSPEHVFARVAPDAGSRSRASACAAQGLTPIAVAVDGRLAAIVSLGDAVRPEAADVIADLKRRGWRVGVLSGDHPDVVRRVAAQVGIAETDARGGMSPEAKLAVVREAQQAIGTRGTVVMVGDGVNDAAALAAAGVGVAVHGGAEASLAAADVYLSRPGLGSIAELLDGSRRSLGAIKRNLWASLGYNVIAGGLAVLGLINPILAAIVMPISSLTALGLTLKARTFAPPVAPTFRGAR